MSFVSEDLQEVFEKLFEIHYLPLDYDYKSNFLGFTIISVEKNFIKLQLEFENSIFV